MPQVVLLPRAEAQIADVLSYTLEEFGEAKYLEYRELISLALESLEITPTAGLVEKHGICSSTVSGRA